MFEPPSNVRPLAATRSLLPALTVVRGSKISRDGYGHHARHNAELRCRPSRTNCCLALVPNDDDPTTD